MAQVVPAVARFELRYQLPDNVVENVYYVRTSESIWSEASMDAVEAAFESWETSTASALRNDACSLFEIVATDLTSLFGLRKSYPVTPPITGTLANPSPANVTIAIKADIGRRGRGVSGRTFWVGMADGQTDGNTIGVVDLNLIVTALNTLNSNIAAIAPIECMCIPHFVVGGVRPPSVLADCITQYLASDVFVDSQRDRLPNHKKHKRQPVA